MGKYIEKIKTSNKPNLIYGKRQLDYEEIKCALLEKQLTDKFFTYQQTQFTDDVTQLFLNNFELVEWKETNKPRDKTVYSHSRYGRSKTNTVPAVFEKDLRKLFLSIAFGRITPDMVNEAIEYHISAGAFFCNAFFELLTSQGQVKTIIEYLISKKTLDWAVVTFDQLIDVKHSLFTSNVIDFCFEKDSSLRVVGKGIVRHAPSESVTKEQVDKLLENATECVPYVFNSNLVFSRKQIDIVIEVCLSTSSLVSWQNFVSGQCLSPEQIERILNKLSKDCSTREYGRFMEHIMTNQFISPELSVKLGTQFNFKTLDPLIFERYATPFFVNAKLEIQSKITKNETIQNLIITSLICYIYK